MIRAQRLIRHKGTTHAINEGNIILFASIGDLRRYAKSVRKVYSFTTDNGSKGIMRSGQHMRPCDAHVWNVKQ